MAESIIIRIIGEDKFSPAALSASKSMQNLGKDITGVGTSLTRGLTVPILAASAGILKLSMDAASLTGVEEAFNGIATAA